MSVFNITLPAFTSKATDRIFFPCISLNISYGFYFKVAGCESVLI